MYKSRNVHLLIILIVFFVSGCAVVWGGAHSIKRADENRFVIQYDTALTSSVRARRLAEEHCGKYGKKAIGDDAQMPGILLGIIEESYKCS